MKKMKKSHRGKAGSERTKKKVVKSAEAHVRDQSPKSGEKPHRPGTFVKGDPRINRKIPGPGRPPGKFARKCRRILNRPKTWGAVRRVLQNENNPAMKGMWAEVSNRGYGRQGSAGVEIQFPQDGGGEEPGQNQVSAVVVLMGRLDQMEKRKDKAKGHLKEA